MKIYSWNVFWSNRKFDRVLEYLADLDFDVLCLQEVPESFLVRLKTLPYEVAEEVEIIRHLDGGRDERIFSVILSRHPIRASGRIEFTQFPRPVRTRIFIELMRPLGWSKNSGRGALYADIDVQGAHTRIFSVHLSLSAPFRRAEEFAAVVRFLPPGLPAVVCGDFNVIEDPFFKPLNWVLGSPLREALPWHDERGPFEGWFGSLGLKNPLLGQITHPFSRSQLDHILVSKSVRVLAAGAITERFGSDHRLIFVEI